MFTKFDALLPTSHQKLLLAILAGLAYYLAFLLNRALGSAILYDNWIALVFIPAGIKHLFILVARGWGALGCFFGLLVPSLQFWNDTPVYLVVLYSGLSTLATCLGIQLGMTFLGIRRHLQNLQFFHLPVLDLITTTVHGLLVCTYLQAVGMTSNGGLTDALAMMFGDYTGSFIVLTCLWLVVQWLKRKNPAKSSTNP